MRDVEDQARRIAEQGRDAVVARLRPAFRDAAKAYGGDAERFDDQQLEQLVQQAADEADGLQWRRALASVAREELGLELGEALLHPAVARAQDIAGAPSYEAAVAALGIGLPSPEEGIEHDLAAREEHAMPATEDETAERLATEDETAEDPATEDETAEEVATEDETAEELAMEDETAEELAMDEATAEEVAMEAATGEDLTIDPTTSEHVALERASAPWADPPAGYRAAADRPLQLVCTHIGGIADLASPEPGVELWFSEKGLDIIRPTHEPLGRLRWDELRAIEVVGGKGRFALRRSPNSYLVIRGLQGDASFELHGATPAELRDQLVSCAGEKVPIV